MWSARRVYPTVASWVYAPEIYERISICPRSDQQHGYLGPAHLLSLGPMPAVSNNSVFLCQTRFNARHEDENAVNLAGAPLPNCSSSSSGVLAYSTAQSTISILPQMEDSIW